MSKKEEKKLTEQELIEKEFHKTTFGKFVKVITIISLILIAVGFIFSIFEAIVYAKNLDINKYQNVIKFGELCFEQGGKSSFFLMLFYVGIVPLIVKGNKKEINKLFISIYTLCIIGPLLKLIYEICNL